MRGDEFDGCEVVGAARDNQIRVVFGLTSELELELELAPAWFYEQATKRLDRTDRSIMNMAYRKHTAFK